MGCCGKHSGGHGHKKGPSLMSIIFVIVAISMIIYILN